MEEENALLTLWAIVQLSDDTTLTNEPNKAKKQLVSVNLQPQWSAKEVQMALLKTLNKMNNIPPSTHRIVKVRDANGALLPLTPTTLQSSPVQPLVLEVCAVHQH
ncbi:hypothetical protein SK128_003028, partial [Halocaridina rubra]